MTLAAQQSEFMAHVLAEDRALPPGWDARFAAGLEIYRNAYRARLVDALREIYPRTAQWAGEDAFRQAAAHHLIQSPPNSWTLDDAGDGFVAVLEELFANDPEVAELGWLEWAMHCAFVAADAEPLGHAAFAARASAFTDTDWAEMRLAFQPGIASRKVCHRCTALWQALAHDEAPPEPLLLDQPMQLFVWRQGLQPIFRLASAEESGFFAMMRGGAGYGTACEELVGRIGEEQAVAAAGQWLGRWIADGMVMGLA